MGWSEKEMAERMIDYYRLWLYERMDLETEIYNNEFSFWNKQRGNSYISCRDFIWSRFNERMARFGQDVPNRYAIERLIELTSEMFKFRLHREKKVDRRLRKLSLKYCLMRDEFSSINLHENYIVEILSGSCCEKCKPYDGTLWWYYGANGIALKQPLPFDFCSRTHGCNCSYNMVPEKLKSKIYGDEHQIKEWVS